MKTRFLKRLEESKRNPGKVKPMTPRERIRVRLRCKLCGRPRAYIRRFEMCRLCFRELALKGEVPGVVKASW